MKVERLGDDLLRRGLASLDDPEGDCRRREHRPAEITDSEDDWECAERLLAAGLVELPRVTRESSLRPP